MSNPIASHAEAAESPAATESNESFQDILSQFERSKSGKPGEAGEGREGTVISVTVDSVLVDIGFKTEGVLPLSAFQGGSEAVKAGDKLVVSIKGRDPEGYYQLTLGRIEQPKDWASLQKAFAEKTTIVGYGDGGGERRAERGCGRACVHASFAQRCARRSRDGKIGGTGDPLPDYQA